MKVNVKTRLQGINGERLQNEVIDTINKRFTKNGLFNLDSCEQSLHSTMLDIAQDNGVKLEYIEDSDNNGTDSYLFYNC